MSRKQQTGESLVQESESAVLNRNTVWKNRLILFGICFAISFLLIMVCSANSFIYAFNDWCDVQWYVTMGRGVASGKVMYRDLFEQKGPLLYLFFAFFCLFKNPFIVIFFAEVISFAFYLYFCYRIARHFASETFSLAAAIIVGFLTAVSPLFNAGGGSVEEYCLPLIAYIFMVFLEYTEKGTGDGKVQNEKFGLTRSLAIGAILGFIFWTKFTVLVVPGIILFTWLILNLIKKRVAESFKSIGFMLIGFVIMTLPVAIYFAANHAFGDLWTCYFYDNLFVYNDNPSTLKIIMNYSKANIWPLFIVLLVLAGLVALYVWLFKKHRLIALWTIPILVQTFLVLNMWQPYTYYFLVFAPYLAFVFALAFRKLSKKNFSKVFQISLCSALLVVTFGLSFLCNNNVRELGRSKNDFAQYQVAAAIKNSGIDNATLFCYKMQDRGYYYALGVVPEEKYYAKNNFPESSFPEMYEAFEKAIKNQNADFVLTTADVFESDGEFLLEYYKVYGKFSYDLYENQFWLQKHDVVLLIKK